MTPIINWRNVICIVHTTSAVFVVLRLEKGKIFYGWVKNIWLYETYNWLSWKPPLSDWRPLRKKNNFFCYYHYYFIIIIITMIAIIIIIIIIIYHNAKIFL